MRYRQPQPFEELDHTADVAVRVHGESAEETLARLVLALGSLLLGGATLPETGEIALTLEPGELAGIAVDALRELLFRFSCNGLVPVSCEVVRLGEGEGAALSVGVARYDAESCAEGLDLKAVTWHEARFARDGDGWSAQIIFDI